MTVTKAATTGDRRDLLVALRARIALSVEDPKTPAPALAALSRRLLEIARELEAIDAEGGGGGDVGVAAATPDEKWVVSGDGEDRSMIAPKNSDRREMATGQSCSHDQDQKSREW